MTSKLINYSVIAVGGNPISAFLSWRLQATNACDVTLVWKSGYEAVSQYGISFKYVQLCSDCQLVNVVIDFPTDPNSLAMNDSNPGMVN